MPDLTLQYRGRKYKLSDGDRPFRIGREPDNDLHVDVDVVSGSHARILPCGAGFRIEDLRSTNGTIVLEKGGVERRLDREGLILHGEGSIRIGGRGGPELAFEVGGEAAPHRREFLLEDALLCLKGGDYEEGCRLTEEMIRTRPDDAVAYYYAGFAASRVEKLDKAILRFEQYLLLRPNGHEVRVDLGKVYERAGDVENARACFQNVLSKVPGHCEARKCLDELTRFEAATPASSRARKTREVLGDNFSSTVEMHPFRVRYFVASHGRILNDVLKGLKISWEDIGGLLGSYSDKTIPVDLIKPHTDVSGKTGPEGIVLAVDQEHLKERPFLSVLVSHEYAHYALGSLMGFSPHVPWWLQEGFAQHVSQNLSPARLLIIKDWIQKNRLIPLDVLEKGLGSAEDKLLTEIAYLEAHTAVTFLFDQLGPEGFHKLLQSLRKGHRPSRAFERSGNDYLRFQREWVAWLGEDAGMGKLRLTRKTRSL